MRYHPPLAVVHTKKLYTSALVALLLSANDNKSFKVER